MPKTEERPIPLCENELFFAHVDGDSVSIYRTKDDSFVGKVPIEGEDAGLANFIAHAASMARARISSD